MSDNVGDILATMLSTEEGQTVSEILLDLKNEIVAQLQMQNKILVKLLTALTPKS